MARDSYVVDAHLDLAYNALIWNRPVLKPAAQQPPDSEGIPTVGLPDLRNGNIAFICATIFALPAGGMGSTGGYKTPDEAQVAGWQQLQWYLEQFKIGEIDFVTEPSEVPTTACGKEGAVPVILLLEGADPLRTPADLEMWFKAGLRIIGMAWKQTRYAGGTNAPGPLTQLGKELIPEMDALGMIHDVSHLAEESFWQLMERSKGPIFASHSNCRTFVPTDRQLSDDMIKALIQRGGVIGLNYYDKFLMKPTEFKTRRANFKDLIMHIDHICQLAGNANHVGIGTDMDGGLGRENIPEEIINSSDLPKLAGALEIAGYKDVDIASILGGNMARFFKKNLPVGS